MGHRDGVGVRIEGNTFFNVTVAGIDMPNNHGSSSGKDPEHANAHTILAMIYPCFERCREYDAQ